jgi:hypothetical protein
MVSANAFEDWGALLEAGVRWKLPLAADLRVTPPPMARATREEPALAPS